MGILDDLLRDIETLMEEAGGTVESNPVPLAGEPKTEFENNVKAASRKSGTALANEFFDGLTGNVLSPPSSTGQLDWWHEMAESTKGVVESTSPTPGQLQQAANELATMSDPTRKAELIDEYT